VGLTISTFETVSDQDVFLAERHPRPVNRPDKFNQLDHQRNLDGHALTGFDRPFRIPQHFNLFLHQQAQGPPPIHHIQKRVVRIEHNTLGHGRLPWSSQKNKRTILGVKAPARKNEEKQEYLDIPSFRIAAGQDAFASKL
jgi:hypothetical protein